jgi:hypothetical protein
MRPLPALLFLLALPGCARWHPQGLTPQAVLEREQPAHVRVTRTDNSHVELNNPVIAGDSIRGSAPYGEMAIPLSQVTYLSLKQRDRVTAPVLVAVGLAGGLIALLAATWN